MPCRKGLASDFTGSPVVKTPHFRCYRDTGSISGWGAKTLHATQCGPKIKRLGSTGAWEREQLMHYPFWERVIYIEGR